MVKNNREEKRVSNVERIFHFTIAVYVPCTMTKHKLKEFSTVISVVFADLVAAIISSIVENVAAVGQSICKTIINALPRGQNRIAQFVYKIYIPQGT